MQPDRLLRVQDQLPDWEDLDCGVDEAGRGPLAGPVVAGAVILDRHRPIVGLKDSKRLTENQRDDLAHRIREQATAWALGVATVEEIDHLNILGATLLAMGRAIAALTIPPGRVWVDGLSVPPVHCPTLAVVKGDDRVGAISAASILAKTARDRLMIELDAQWPDYGFRRHKGYPTAFHLRCLKQFGVTPHHRRSFGPVRDLTWR